MRVSLIIIFEYLGLPTTIQNRHMIRDHGEKVIS